MAEGKPVIVAGVDFGTLSVRVSIFDSVKGRLGSATGEYPLTRKKEDPDYATQSHRDHMRGLVRAMGRRGSRRCGGRWMPRAWTAGNSRRWHWTPPDRA